jgi:hypothetical protein
MHRGVVMTVRVANRKNQSVGRGRTALRLCLRSFRKRRDAVFLIRSQPIQEGKKRVPGDT